MVIRSVFPASIAALILLAAMPAHADELSANNVYEGEVPALQDGPRIAIEDVERAILNACNSRKFRATVVAPGLITARWRRHFNSVEVSIPYSDAGYSIRYLRVKRMDAVESSESVSELAENIDASLDDALKRLKSLQKPMRRPKRISPRSAA